MTTGQAGTAYQRGRALADEALRASLLDTAGSLLVRHGSAALTMRRLAEESGCSTTVLYRLFQGKHGIVQGLYREGFERLRRLLADLTAPDPLERLRSLAYAYRDYALAEPAYYAVMFSRPVPEFQPSGDDVAHARRSLGILADAVAGAQAAGRLGGPDPAHVAEVLWAAAHGAVSLELAGHLADPAGLRVFTDLTTAAIGRFLLPAGG